LQIYNKSNN